jgi:hypothetical protein
MSIAGCAGGGACYGVLGQLRGWPENSLDVGEEIDETKKEKKET